LKRWDLLRIVGVLRSIYIRQDNPLGLFSVGWWVLMLYHQDGWFQGQGQTLQAQEQREPEQEQAEQAGYRTQSSQATFQ